MMTSVTREREGLPSRDRVLWVEARVLWVEARRIANELAVGPQIALVRCEAGRTYGRERASIKILQELKLVQPAAWRVTPLGRCVVELLCR